MSNPDSAARHGDTAVAWDADEAVTRLYASHYASLVRLAAMLVRSTEEAEEVVQDAFVALHGRWRRLREPDRAIGYLRQTVVNTARSRLRRRGVEQRHRPAPLADVASAEQVVLATETRRSVIAAVRTLPERQREAIALRYFADLSEADTAATMGISRGAVKSHTFRGIAALRELMEVGQ